MDIPAFFQYNRKNRSCGPFVKENGVDWIVGSCVPTKAKDAPT